jgi:hypothetical protein
MFATYHIQRSFNLSNLREKSKKISSLNLMLNFSSKISHEKIPDIVTVKLRRYLEYRFIKKCLKIRFLNISTKRS